MSRRKRSLKNWAARARVIEEIEHVLTFFRVVRAPRVKNAKKEIAEFKKNSRDLPARPILGYLPIGK